MIFNVTHTTKYEYNAPVSYCHNIATLRPRESKGQELLDYKIQITPEPAEISERIDFFGNFITRFSIQTEHKILKVTTKSKIKREYAQYHELFNSAGCSGITMNDALFALKGMSPEILEAKQYTLESIFIRRTDKNIRETLPAPGKKKLVGADASHAWFAIFIPGFGWVDFDPTNNQIPKDQHIVVGWGRDYYDVPPLKGVVYGSGQSTLKVAVDIAAVV